MEIMGNTLKEAYEKMDPSTSAEYMAELLMDPDASTWKMFERLVNYWLNGTEEYRKGLNDAVIEITGWSLDTIAKELLERAKGEE